LKVALPEARKANDADDSAFKGAVVVEKAEFEEFFVVKSKAPKKATDKVKKEKVLVDIEQRFAEKPREFRAKPTDRRGGRAAGKNGRRGNKTNAAAPAVNLQDASAFPTLGATA
jgi:plasminogen activator inhibitor 1 RNA-binding protein